MEFPYFKKGLTLEQKEAEQKIAEDAIEKNFTNMENPDPFISYNASQAREDMDLNIHVQRVQEDKEDEKFNSAEAEVFLNRLDSKRFALNQKIRDIIEFTGPDTEQIQKEEQKLKELRLQETELQSIIITYMSHYGARAEEHSDTQKALAQYDLYLKKVQTIESKIEELQQGRPMTSEEEDMWEKRKQELLKEEKEIQDFFENTYDDVPGSKDFKMYKN